MLQLGNSFLDNHELRARSLMWAGSLAMRVGEAVRVGVMNGNTVLIVHHVFRPDNSVQILEVGASIPWHACALGKAVVAFVSPARRTALLGADLSPLTGRTMTEPSLLRTALEEVSALGIAVEDQEAVVGEAEIASPGVRSPRAAGRCDRRRRTGGTAPARWPGARVGRRGEGGRTRVVSRHGRGSLRRPGLRSTG